MPETFQNIEAAVIDLVHNYSKFRIKPEHKSMRKEIRSLEFWRSITAEFLATCFFVILLCGSTVPWPNYSPNIVHISLTGGLAIASLVQCFGHISGGHINPAVTFAMLLTKKISPLRGLFYVMAQCLGALAGSALLFGLTNPDFRGSLGGTYINDAITPWQGLVVELILTFVLVFTVFATVDPHRKELGSSSLAIGLVVLVAHLMGVSFTGAGINPARSLGPSFMLNKWDYHWVYWVGPLTGAALAGLFYEYMFDPRHSVKGLKEALGEIDEENAALKKKEAHELFSKRNLGNSQPNLSHAVREINVAEINNCHQANYLPMEDPLGIFPGQTDT